MLVDLDTEVRTRRQDQIHDAERHRLVALARAGRAGGRRSLAGSAWRLRQAAGFGLVRTGLRLLDTGRA